jgi:hypothetical protein
MIRPRRSAIIWWTALVAVAAFVAYGIVYVRGAVSDRARDAQRIELLSQQVRDLGGTPVVGPKGDPGTEGQRGADGSPGRDGQAGRDGDDGTPGKDGDTGPSGTPGVDGNDGVKGADGAEGPAGDTGPVGPTGPEGPQGEQGDKGEKGDKGDRGDVGPAIMCPDGYTPTQTMLLSGTYMLCKED